MYNKYIIPYMEEYDTVKIEAGQYTNPDPSKRTAIYLIRITTNN